MNKNPIRLFIFPTVAFPNQYNVPVSYKEKGEKKMDRYRNEQVLSTFILKSS